MSLELLQQHTLEKTEFRGDTTLTIAPENLREVCIHCKKMLGFDLLLDITATDHLDRTPRFDVTYELNRSEDATQLRIKTSPVPPTFPELPALPTVTDIWPGADWLEREVYDLSGVKFTDHPDLRRLNMWEGYQHHPLHKDFPLAGVPTDIPELAFSEAAPLKGGPFVSETTDSSPRAREPRSHSTF